VVGGGEGEGSLNLKLKGALLFFLIIFFSG
jgi:hypothetical protein